ncbi:hypothetical protein BJV85_000386 [Clostridium acetobutylicum]|nr:hypothetical protein [Clostridium acetobutylicum]NRY58255.1 hypothetical protein [Clostridium acetobutylicum]NSA91540.1 hypothetical protein [Clostridium acetobutylicum]
MRKLKAPVKLSYNFDCGRESLLKQLGGEKCKKRY